MSEDFLLTTTDNPYNPWTDWDMWYAYDERMGYHTCAFLARVMSDAEGMTEAEEDRAYNDAANEIIKYDPFGLYAKISKADKTPMVPVSAQKH